MTWEVRSNSEQLRCDACGAKSHHMARMPRRAQVQNWEEITRKGEPSLHLCPDCKEMRPGGALADKFELVPAAHFCPACSALPPGSIEL